MQSLRCILCIDIMMVLYFALAKASVDPASTLRAAPLFGPSAIFRPQRHQYNHAESIASGAHTLMAAQHGSGADPLHIKVAKLERDAAFDRKRAEALGARRAAAEWLAKRDRKEQEEEAASGETIEESSDRGAADVADEEEQTSTSEGGREEDARTAHESEDTEERAKVSESSKVSDEDTHEEFKGTSNGEAAGAKSSSDEEDIHRRLLHDDHADHADHVMTRSQNVAAKLASVPQMMPTELNQDRELFYTNFMPGWHLNLWLMKVIVTSVAGSMAWFAFYFARVFRSDALTTEGHYADDGLDETARDARRPDEKPNRFVSSSRFSGGLEPDIVIVLPHPAHRETQDAAQDAILNALDKQTVPRLMIEHILAQQLPGAKADLHRVRAFAAVSSKGGDAVADMEAAAAALEGADGVKIDTLQQALLDDFLEILPLLGFDCEIYSSLDEEELFLCIALNDPQWIHKYLLWQRRELQVHRCAADSLGLGPVERVGSSPPFLRFDPWVVECAYEAKVIPENHPTGLFAMNDCADHKEASITMLRERIQTIYVALSSRIDLDGAKEHGLIKDWFPAHNLDWLNVLADDWANPANMTDYKFEQPLSLINNYFGSQIAFNFSWIGLYCKALLGLLPAAIAWEIMTNMFGLPQVLVGSIGVIVWTKIASNLWEREQAFLLENWNINEENHDIVLRPQFRGNVTKSPVDGNKLELTMPHSEAKMRWGLSTLATFSFCLAVAFIIFTWASIFDGQMDIFASICLVIMIKIFQFTWDRVSMTLTNFENHKYMAEYHDSLLWKQVIFQFVNNYWAFFYLAVKQRYTEHGCPGGCLSLLRRQLITSLVILSLVRIGEVIFASVWVRFLIYRELKRREKDLGHAPPKECFTEEQSNYSELDIRSQIQMILQPVISIGFVILFGGVAPVIVPFVLAVFVVQLRASAFLLVATTKRTLPRISQGIGAWGKVLAGLRGIGALFASYLLVVYGAMFKGQQVITRLTGMFGFVLFILILWEFVDQVVPTQSPEAKLLAKRRAHVKDRIFAVCAHVSRARHREQEGGDAVQQHFVPSIQAASAGNWGAVPKFPSSARR